MARPCGVALMLIAIGCVAIVLCGTSSAGAQLPFNVQPLGKRPSPTPTPTATPAPFTVSYYVIKADLNNTTFYNEGCGFGQSASQPSGSYVILDFGSPWVLSGGTEGTLLPGASAGDTSQFVADSQIQSLSESFVSGLYACNPLKYVHLIIGTTNCCSGSLWQDECGGDNANATASGLAFGNMLVAIDTWIDNSGLSNTAEAFGGVDAELDFNSEPNTLCWIQYFALANLPNNGGEVPLTNFGDLGGCPPVGACDNGWSQSLVWQAWGTYNYYLPFPEIYNTTGATAQEWVSYASYVYTQCAQHGCTLNEPGSPFNGEYPFGGVLTQYGACLQRGGCSGINNTPSQAMAQMQQYMIPSEMEFFPTPFSTDISWQT
jgi:hypothetical protein